MTETSASPVRSSELADSLPALRTALDEQRTLRTEQLAAYDVTVGAGNVVHGTQTLGYVEQALVTAALSAIDDIDQALRRMDDGSYGQCEQCQGDIPLERLEILPMAPHCMRCQRAREAAGLPA